MDLARPHLRPIQRALDVGCGAGLSTRALLPFARHVIGLEPAEGMLAWRRSIAPTADFVVGAAESLPFATGSVDLIAAAGSLNYVALDRFFPEAARVLQPGGQLLVYDFSQGRNFTGDDTLSAWFTAFVERYPNPVAQARRLNPEILAGLHPRFVLGAHQDFALAIELEPAFYLEYMLTETNVASAVARAVPPGEVRAWCAETLAPVWAGRAREVVFRGYFACLAPVAT